MKKQKVTKSQGDKKAKEFFDYIPIEEKLQEANPLLDIEINHWANRTIASCANTATDNIIYISR